MKKRPGITIAELVIYLGILSVLLVVFVNMFAVLVNRQLETEGVSSSQYDSSYLLQRFIYDFGRAASIEVPPTPGSASASLRFIADSNVYEYSASAGALLLTTNGVSEELSSSETTISNPVFLRLGIGDRTDVVQIQFDITSKSQSTAGSEVVHFSTVLGLRDK